MAGAGARGGGRLAEPGGGLRGAWAGLGLGLVVSVAIAAWQHASPRLLVSWHGLLHAAIVERFPTPLLPPENPFFAGEPLPYYWAYHAAAAGLGALLGVDPLHALQLLVLGSFTAGLAVLGWAGARTLGGATTGLLAGAVAWAGAGALGPLIALARAAGGATLFDPASGVGNVFVSDAAADAAMSHPLLGQLYLFADWRIGSNLPWLLDSSSRAVALAGLLALAALWTGPARPARLLAMGLVAAGVTAANPALGLPAAGALLGAAVLLRLLGDRVGVAPGEAGLPQALACAIGAVLVAPTWLHLLGAEGGSGPTPLAVLPGRAVALGAAFALPLPLALAGAWRAPASLRGATTGLLLAGLALLAGAWLLTLPEGNQHNLANAASALLALPAVAWLPGARHRGRMGAALLAAILPGAAATLLAFTGRPGLPLAFEGGALERTPSGDGLARLERYLATETPRDAVLVADPDRPIKMAGNVSELPALTGRVLYVDEPSYLTRPLPGFAARTRLARQLAEGRAPDAGERAALEALGRPVLLVVAERAPRYDTAFGPPLFAAGPWAIYRLAAAPEDLVAGPRTVP